MCQNIFIFRINLLRYPLLAGLLAAISTQHGQAAENWDLCRVPSYTFVQGELSDPDGTSVEAGAIASEDEEQIRFVGEVSIQRSGEGIRADEVLFNKTTREMQASGNVVYENLDYRLQSEAIQIDDSNDRARFEQPRFELRGRHARGQADRIEKLDSTRSRFRNLEYTSCDPGDPDWRLRAREMEIDDASGRGTARHTTLYFQEVPFLYLPWFQFPVDDRRLSGVLAPRIGYSDESGNSLSLPVYWNMAPNYDMTITPAWYSDRGLQLNTENRYLFGRNRGHLDLSYLDDDDVDDSRWFQQWRHESSLTGNIKSELVLAEVSDADFFDDFDDVAPAYNDISHLERRLELTRPGRIWNSELQWQDYQTLDPATAAEDRPYERLPRLAINSAAVPLIAETEGRIQSEWVNFERDDSVSGERTNIVTTLAWRSSESWYFFEPELQLAFTDYRLEDNPAGDDMIYRSLPTLGIDTGLIFERMSGSRRQWLQTLEPRLYFLHTPFEDQDEIPDFDTSLASSTYNNLFRNNRFIGADRIGDASQVTVGLASRLYDNHSGNELLHARIGQIHYFKDRRVSLDGSRDDESRSDVITEIDFWPNPRLKLSSRLVYSREDSDLNDRDLSINYSDNGFAANLGYYFTEDELEQALVSFVYPVNERWTLLGKTHRSLLFEEPVENLLGIAYESCCWGLKILAGQSGDEIDDFSDTEESIYFEITLKGLSDAGQDIDSRLHKAIPGYVAEF